MLPPTQGLTYALGMSSTTSYNTPHVSLHFQRQRKDLRFPYTSCTSCIIRRSVLQSEWVFRHRQRLQLAYPCYLSIAKSVFRSFSLLWLYRAPQHKSQNHKEAPWSSSIAAMAMLYMKLRGSTTDMNVVDAARTLKAFLSSPITNRLFALRAFAVTAL